MENEKFRYLARVMVAAAGGDHRAQAEVAKFDLRPESERLKRRPVPTVKQAAAAFGSGGQNEQQLMDVWAEVERRAAEMREQQHGDVDVDLSRGS